MTLHHETVPYKWTTLDHTNAHTPPDKEHPPKTNAEWDEVINRRGVTPYGILPEYFAASKAFGIGATVQIPLERSFLQPWRADRFFYRDDLVWKPLPEEAVPCRTLGELCDKMLALSQDPKFAERYGGLYEHIRRGEKLKDNFARVLFEHWDNTKYRWDLVEHGFDYKLLETPQKLATTGPSVAIKVVPTRPPKVRSVDVAPGTQSVCLDDPNLDAIVHDITEIERLVARIRDLINKSETVMSDRMALVQSYAALRTLFEASAASAKDNSDVSVKLAGKTKDLEGKANDAARKTTVREVLGNYNVPHDLEIILRRELGFVDNIAAEIGRLIEQLKTKLLADQVCGDRCRDWVKYIFKHRLELSPIVKSRSERLDAAVAEALNVMMDSRCEPDGDTADKLFDILTKLPEAAPVDASAFPDQTSFLHTAAVWLKAVRGFPYQATQLVSSAVGNVAGPPSIFVALGQSWLWLRFLKVRYGNGQSAASAAGAFRTLLDDAKQVFAKILAGDDALRQTFDKALATADKRLMKDAYKGYLDKMGNEAQASRTFKRAVLGLQLLAIAISIVNAIEDSKLAEVDPTRRNIVSFDIIQIGGQVIMFGAGVFEAWATAHKLTELASLASSVGLLAGGVVSFIGAFMAWAQYNELTKDPNANQWDKAALIATIVGDAALGVFSMLALVGVTFPPMALVGGLLVGGAAVIQIVRGRIEESRPPVNRLAELIIKNMRKNPFFSAMTCKNDFEEAMNEISASVLDVRLPSPPNRIEVGKRLSEVGFTREQIEAVVDKGSYVFPALSATAGAPQ